MVPLVERGLEPKGGGGSTCLEASEHSVPLEAACLLGGDPGGQEEIMGALRLDKVPHGGVSLEPGVPGLLHLHPHAPLLALRLNT